MPTIPPPPPPVARHRAGAAASAAALSADAAPETIAVVGAGRAGRALAIALHAAGHEVVAVHSLSLGSANRLADLTGAVVTPTAVAAMARAAVTLVTVPDEAIPRIAATVAATGVPLGGRTVIHCSGAQSRAALAALRQSGAAVAVLHPLQALTGDVGADALRGAYVGIESDAAGLGTVHRLVEDLGAISFAIPAGDRALYHAAAVFAGNAPLALLDRAARLLVTAGVDPATAGQALAVLLEGAARNARRLGVAAALTGPVVRDDAATVARHLRALRGDRESQLLYHRLALEMLQAAGSDGRPRVAELLGRPVPTPMAVVVRSRPAARATTAERQPRPGRRRVPPRLVAG